MSDHMNPTDVRCPDCRGEGWHERINKGVPYAEPCGTCGGEGWLSRRDIEHERHERNGRGDRL